MEGTKSNPCLASFEVVEYDIISQYCLGVSIKSAKHFWWKNIVRITHYKEDHAKDSPLKKLIANAKSWEHFYGNNMYIELTTHAKNSAIRSTQFYRDSKQLLWRLLIHGFWIELNGITTVRVSDERYESIKKAVTGWKHNENQVIAKQQLAHPDISLQQFIAYGSLRAGTLYTYLFVNHTMYVPIIVIN